MKESLLARLPALQRLESESLETLEMSMRIVDIPIGTKVFVAGMQCEGYLMLAQGRIRVQLVSETGREIVLYRVGDGESCILTTACLLAHELYSAEAIAETDASALVVPRATFDQLLATSTTFRNLVFNAYASRLTDLMRLVEEVAFGRIDQRLAQRLLARSNASDTVVMTHQDLAVELGTAREVISRQLKEFERRDWIKPERGRVEICNRSALQALSRDS